MMTRDYAAPDWRGLCEELAGWIERSTRHYIQDPDVLIRARAALAQPEPEGEVGELARWLRENADSAANADHHEPAELLRRAADLLEQRHPAPVPVSERLPGPEDCDEKGRCWWLHVGEDGVGDWFQRAPYPSATSYAFFRMTHWLPAHALPLPSGDAIAAELEGAG